MRNVSEVLKYLVWVTSLSASLIAPVVVSVFAGLWLRRHFALGAWVMIVALVLGLATAGANLARFFRFMQKESDRGSQQEKEGRHGRF